MSEKQHETENGAEDGYQRPEKKPCSKKKRWNLLKIISVVASIITIALFIVTVIHHRRSGKDISLYSLPDENGYGTRAPQPPPTLKDIENRIHPVTCDLLKAYLKNKDLSILETAIRTENNNPEIASTLHTTRAANLINHDETNKAVESLEKALSLDPHNWDALKFLFLSYSRMRDELIDKIQKDSPSLQEDLNKIKDYTFKIKDLKNRLKLSAAKIVQTYGLNDIPKAFVLMYDSNGSVAQRLVETGFSEQLSDSSGFFHNGYATVAGWPHGILAFAEHVIPLAERQNGQREQPLPLDMRMNPENSLAAKDNDLNWTRFCFSPNLKQSRTCEPIKKLRLLAIGIDEYNNNSLIRPLEFAASDAKRVADAFSPYGFKPKILVNEQASKLNIYKSLASESFISDSNDTFVLYVAGHGLSDKHGNKFIIAYNEDGSRNDIISVLEIEVLLQAHKGKVNVIIDTCFEKREIDLTGYLAQFELLKGGGGDEKKIDFLFSSSIGEKAIESQKFKSGLTTHALLEYLNRNPEKIDFGTMFDYASNRTTLIARDVYSSQQHCVVVRKNCK